MTPTKSSASRVPDGHPLKRHVLYRLTIERWHAVHLAGYG